MAILSSAAGRRHSLLRLTRQYSSLYAAFNSCPPAAASDSSAADPLPAPRPITAGVARYRLRREFDPDKAVTILSTVSAPSSPASSRYALDLTVRRLARARRPADVETLINTHKSSPNASNENFVATLINAYGTAGMVDHAISLFNEVPTLCSAPPTVVSFNAVLSACMRAWKYGRIPYLFTQLSNDHSIHPDAISYGILVKSLCISGKSDSALEMVKEAEEKGVKPTIVTYTPIIDALYREGKPEEAEKLWSEMVGKGCEPDLTAYNVKAMYQALHGTPEAVLAVVTEIESAGLKPDTITYNHLITSYCKNGRFQDAKGVYERMLKGGDKKWYNGATKKGGTNAATFKNFLHLLCESGDIDAGLGVFKDAVRLNKIPDFPTTSLLVEGLVKGSQEEEAKRVIEQVKKRFPESSLGRWIALEKKLGLVEEAEVSDQLEAA